MTVENKVMIHFRSWAWLLALVAVMSSGAIVHAEMSIRLRNGDVITLPIDAADIEAIEFGAVKGSAATLPTPPAPQSAEPSPTSAPAPGATLAYAPTPVPDGARVLRVGPGRDLKVPSQAARIARDGDVIEIDAGDYPGDVAVWRANRLLLRGVGGRARLNAEGNAAEGKAIWVIKGDDVAIEAVEFSGARVADKNGAGIRAEGTNLTIRGSAFFDNEMGILAGRNPASEIVVEFSEFARNTVDYRKYGRLGHNIYIGNIRRFVLRGSYVHGAVIGHNVKTRAATNLFLYNRIMDGRDGGSSYLIDLANGGDAYVIGNLFHQSSENDNPALISYAAEGGREDAGRELYVVNNTFVNDFHTGTFVKNHGATLANVINNIAVGPGALVSGPAHTLGNLVGDDPGFVDRERFNYRLTPASPALDAGIEPGSASGVALAPAFEYVHPLGLRPRRRNGPLDAGAYEFGEP